MKYILDKETLLEILNQANKFSSSRGITLPVLQGVMIEAEKNSLVFTSTNLNVFYQRALVVDGVGDEALKVVVDAKKVVEFLALLSPGEIEVVFEQNKIAFVQKKAKGAFPLSAATDFPQPAVLEEKPQSVSMDFLQSVVPFLTFSTAKDETRPVLTAICLTQRDDKPLMVATDGFRLSLCDMKQKLVDKATLIPADFLLEVIRQVRDEKEIKITISQEQHMMKVESAIATYHSRLVEGDFPPYEKVIPSSVITTVTCDADELQRATKLVSVFARESSNIVLFGVDKTGLTLKPKGDISDEVGTVIDARVEGESLTVAFNNRFILEYLQHTKSKEVVIEFLRSDAPVVFRETEREGAMHIIMPVRIQT
jgi:DNA polymerase-3 subunit beta